VDALAQVWRDEWGRLLALLVARYRRLDLAEDALADAFAAASRWDSSTTPANPPAWLLTAARRRVVDRLRAEAVAARKQPLLAVDAALAEADERAAVDPGGLLVDERLRLILLCAHPALAPEAATALTLRLVLGLPTVDIARLFVVTEPAMAARLTRAKRKIVTAGVPFAVPEEATLSRRLDTVADVVYLAFTAGYAPGAGPDAVRVELAGEAIRLARVVREVVGARPVLDALLALMLLQHARRDARTDADGGVVLLPDQDRARWRHDEITEALELLMPLLERPSSGRAASYVLQAAIAAEHAVATTPAATRWDRIAARYAELDALTGSPVVRLNRAVAVAEADGAAAGLALLAGLDARLPASHRLPGVRAELLARLGRVDEARAAFDDALALGGNGAEAAHLRRRREALVGDR
jgi:RNA polymerase sigma-70 factor (ECF subfamily)